MSELAGPRDDVKLPLQGACIGVVCQNVARDVLDARLQITLLGRVSDDHRSVDHDRRRGRRDISEFQRDSGVRVERPTRVLPWAPAVDDVSQHILTPRGREPLDGNGFSPVREGLAGYNVQGVKEETRSRDVGDSSPVTLAVRDTFTVGIPHGVLVPAGVRLGKAPEQLARRRVEPNHGATLPCDRDQLSVHIGWGRPRCARPKAGRVERPCNFEILEIRCVDLVGRRVTRVPRVTTEIGPLTVLRPGSLSHARRWQRKYGAECKSEP